MDKFNLNFYPRDFLVVVHTLQVEDKILKNTHLKNKNISIDGEPICISLQEFIEIKKFLNRKVDLNDIVSKRVENTKYLEKFKNKYIIIK